MSGGTTISSDTSPFESALKKYVSTRLNSWICPTWFAGTWVAVTVTLPPGTVMFGLTDSVAAWLTTTAHTPMSKSSSRTAARPIISRRRERLGAAATVGGGDG